MTTNEFNQLWDETIVSMNELVVSKGADYASEADRLSNFKGQAEKLGLTPYQIWAVYANKHWDAINAFVRNDGQLESEPIESRIHDIMVYSLLLLGLVKDKEQLTVTGTTVRESSDTGCEHVFEWGECRNCRLVLEGETDPKNLGKVRDERY